MPVFQAVGAVAGVVGLGASFFGQKEKNNQANKSADAQNDYNEEMWDFNNESAQKVYEYNKKGLEITKQNNANNKAYSEAMSIQAYSDAMAMKNYKETEKFNAWTTSLSQATEQISFNAMATAAANTQQGQAYSEQMVGLMYDSKQTLQDYGMATMGLSVKRKAERAASTASIQQQKIDGMKASAAQKAKGGTGRSSTKAVIGLMAESGARQADIVQQLLFNEQGLDLDVTKLKAQLILDKSMIVSTAENLAMNDKAMKLKFLQDQVQADMNAMANVMTKPTILPAIPKPFALPDPIYQEILKPTKPPKPGEVIAQTTNPWLGVVSSAASGVAAGAAAGIKNGGSFGWMEFLGGL